MTNLSSPPPNFGGGSKIVIILCFLFAALSTAAANPLDIMINEIAWMGTNISANDEWIELYNSTNLPISLDGWQLVAQDETPKINLSGTIPANGFYLLERTDDNTLPDISADQIYTGALNNIGEKLELYDNSGNLIDLVDCSSGWLAGDNVTKQTMERVESKNWQSSQNTGGTPKAKNSIISMIEVEPQSSSTLPQEKLKPLAYSSGVVFNEIIPSPEGPDVEEEWIEIYNQNNFEVDLSGWQITDSEGKTTTYAFPEGTKILSKGYLVLTRPVSKITLNNDGDGLKLTSPDGKIADSVEYIKAPKGRSFNRIKSSWIWSDVLTPGSLNKNPSKISEKESETELGILKTTTDGTNSELQSKEGLAAVSQPFEEIRNQKIPKSYFPYLIAASLAVFSGAVIFSLKRLLKD